MAAAEVEPATDEQLVEALARGDRDAFDTVYERYYPRIYRFVDRRMANRADVEETVQEVFINVFSSIHTFRGDAPFAAWVFGLTRRTIANRFKKKRADFVPLVEPENETVPAALHAVQPSSDPHEAYECSERLDRMEAAIRDDLTREQWQLFRLHHLENRPIQEIADVVSKSEDSVKSHLYRARKLLLAR